MDYNTNPQEAISLPKGGGAIQGIGETFSPDLFTGTGNFSVPIALSPGRSGFQPSLNLAYSTSNGNSPFGLGWALSIPRITRKTEKGLPRYTDEDVFVLSGAEDLVLADIQPSDNEQPAGYFVERYRPRTEGLFARIEKWTRKDGEDVGSTHWRIVTKENLTNLYGKSESARITDPDHKNHVYEWLLEQTFDNKGNHILYEYVQENPNLEIKKIFEENRKYTQTYIRRVLYGNTPEDFDESKQFGPRRVGNDHLHPDQTRERHYLFELLFDYGDLANLPELPYAQPLSEKTVIPESWPIREDPFSNFRPGFEVRTLRRCRRVLMLHHFEELGGAPLIRSTDFAYDLNPDAGISLLRAVQVKGYRKEGDNYRSSSMPPVTFGYSKFEPQKQRYRSVEAKGNDLPPRSLNDNEFSLVDLFGDALPDIVRTTGEGAYDYWQNLGDAKIDRRHPQHGPIPTVSPSQPNVAFGDMGGDGVADIVVDAPPISGFFESTPEGRWKPFKKFQHFPSLNLNDPNLRLLDLTGDGLSDILVTRDQHFLWFQCLGEAGYSEPRHIERSHDLNEFPDIYFNDSSGRFRLADMSGDGLNDIVLINNGRIDYWPNLGYGRFGKRITMAQSPRLPENINLRQVFLVDIDGTGCTDLVYVNHCQVQFWFNQSGNAWSEKQTIQGTPYITDNSAIQFADFFGTGTTSLIWSYDYQNLSGGNYKVLDFCGGLKPHLLTEMDNNMGATTRVQYAASTKFYLEDKAAGTPWATHLPFPVQVVEKSEIIDHIGKTKLVTSYKYHHGYYDGREREFRGFGRVDQYDTESYEEFSESSLHGNEITFDNKALPYHVQPVLTKTWFHSGVSFDENNISPSGTFYDHNDLMDAYRKEFYQGDQQAFVLNNHQVIHTDNPHQAYRALRGATLRTEVYGMDGTDKAEHPYTVTENRYQVQELQAKNSNNYGVYLSTLVESLSYQYERNPDDPRVGQNLVLNVDAYGQVTDNLAIAYPRRQVSNELPEQAELKLIYTKTDYINKPSESEYYYLGIPCQTRTYEVSGANWSSGDQQLSAEDFLGIMAPALIPGDFCPFEWKRPNGHIGLEKRIIEWQRTYFRTDASPDVLDITRITDNHPMRTLTNRLPLGDIERFALPYESYTAACTDDLQTLNFDGPAQVTTTMLLTGGYHQEADIPGYWWVPSGQQAFDQELFYLAYTSRDPFGFDSNITYDPYALAAIEVVDARKNTVKADINYRVLQPEKVTDPNGNRSTVVFDTLGLVAGSAVMGKESENIGDLLTDDFRPDLTQSEIDSFLNAPRTHATELLKSATTRIVYDLHRYQNTGQPPLAATLARETHVNDSGPDDPVTIQIAFSYSDGFGRTVQNKVQAEPDKASPNIPRWVGSGTIIYNNKGKAVRQYEPFFSDNHHFGIEQHGVSPTLFYDPLERVVATLHPNHTYEKVVFDPWRQESWDVNDTVLQPDPKNDPDIGAYFKHLPGEDYLPSWRDARLAGQRGDAERSASEKVAAHADTPSIAHLDSLGRTVLTVADNAQEGKYESRVVLDIEDNQIEVIDAKDRIVMQYAYDLLGSQVKQTSMEAGTRWLLIDVAGKPIYGWDSRNHRTRHTYDQLQRPTGLYVSTDRNSEDLAERTTYGEDQTNPEQLNLRGQVYQIFDGAGVVTNLEYDFKGNPLHGQRQLLQNYQNQVDWSQSPSLESEIFASSTRFDALNRPIQIVAPHSNQGGSGRNVIQPVYNEANLLDGVGVWTEQNTEPNALLDPASADQFAVKNIDYDAKGQRQRIEYGNGVLTEYEYDPDTFRLVRLKTTRSGFPGNETRVQDLHYAYDPAGNISSIRDDAQQTVFFNNAVVEPHTEYWYDAIYRLIEVHGREHLGQTGGQLHSPVASSHHDAPRVNLLHPGDGRAMGNYIESYEYDEVGNINSVNHEVPNALMPNRWVRNYLYQETSLTEPAKTNNRLSSTIINGDTVTYHHDKHGNMINMPHLQTMDWDFKDQLHRVDLNGGGEAWYAYDAAGQRVRKIVKKNGGNILEERIYLGGFEVFRKRVNDNLTLERETLHVMDDAQRIALVETKTIDTNNDPSPAKLFRYQLGNHLGSASLELDDGGKVISYEEYFPYGSTAYQAVDNSIQAAAKRYRYTGKERDEETGFSYHGARYYITWLSRWASTDPVGLQAGVNLYMYVNNNPIKFTDPQGTQEVCNVNTTCVDEYGNGFTPDRQTEPTPQKTPINVNDGRTLDLSYSNIPIPGEPGYSEFLNNAVKINQQEKDFAKGQAAYDQLPPNPVTRGFINVGIGSSIVIGAALAVPSGGATLPVVGAAITGIGGGTMIGFGSIQIVGGATGNMTSQEAAEIDDLAAHTSTIFDPYSGPAYLSTYVATGDSEIALRTGSILGLTSFLGGPVDYSRLYSSPIPIITIRYTEAMGRSPSAANFLRINAEWAQSSSGFLNRGSRVAEDAKYRAKARSYMKQQGKNLTMRDAMHPLDSSANPWAITGQVGTTYYFGHRSVNRSFGAQLGNGFRKYNIGPGDPFKLEFINFPGTNIVAPMAPLASPPNLYAP